MPSGFLLKMKWGVCAGDGLSCRDCAGTINGTMVADHCGNCDRNATNDCRLDCLGIWGGANVFDPLNQGEGAGRNIAKPLEKKLELSPEEKLRELEKDLLVPMIRSSNQS